MAVRMRLIWNFFASARGRGPQSICMRMCLGVDFIFLKIDIVFKEL